MNYTKMKDVKEFTGIVKYNIYGFDNVSSKLDYMIFYNYRSSQIYNTNTNEQVKIQLTNFDPYVFDIENNSIYLFLRSSKMTKTQEYTIYQYDINTGEKISEFLIPKEVWRGRNLLIEKIFVLPNRNFVVLMLEFPTADTRVYEFLYMNRKSEVYHRIKIGDNVTVDYSSDYKTFLLGDDLYALCRGRGEQIDLNEMKREDRFLVKYNNGQFIEKYVLDSSYNEYGFIASLDEKYVAYIKENDTESRVRVYEVQSDNCILDKVFNFSDGIYIGQNPHVENSIDTNKFFRYGFSHDKKGDVTFFREYQKGYDIYNLVEKTNYKVLSTFQFSENGNIGYAELLTNDKIIKGIYSQDKESNVMKRKICSYELP